MAEKEYYTYEELGPEGEKKQIYAALQWLAAGPKFITEAENGQEFIDRVKEFSKILYANFPIKKGGNITRVPMLG